MSNLKTAVLSQQETPLFANNKKHFVTIEKTYRNNKNSDYTEKIEVLGKSFDYAENSDRYWGPAELSTLYGTPVYEQASPSQKLALNHLYWIGQYSHTANSEANTMHYNRVTAGVFAHLNDYETLREELDFETDQEKYHIKTFHKIGYKTKTALLGKSAFGNTVPMKTANPSLFLRRFSLDKIIETHHESAFRKMTGLLLGDKKAYYSQYLKAQGEQTLPTTSGGLAGLTGSHRWLKFLTLNWGGSPFLATQYYSIRMVANMSLKAYEHKYFRYFRQLEKSGEFVPIPTEVSYFHLLDESFHTTMSQVISQEVCKDFPKPTAYEQALANFIVYSAQKGVIGGLSAGLPLVFRADDSFLPSYYRLLKSPLFEMSTADALHWLEKCLCQEHEGLAANVKHHKSLLEDFRRFFGRLDYLWPVNREMKVMAAGNSVERALKNNIESFKRFSRLVNSYSQDNQ